MVIKVNMKKSVLNIDELIDEYKKSDSYYQAKIDELTNGMF